MARRIPENRFDELVRCATEVFIALGYRLTQMSDIAEAVGVAKGTLYGYVESKDALLLLCLIRADQVETISVPESLPLRAPAPGSIQILLKERLAEETAPEMLALALSSSRAVDPLEELIGVVGELYDLMSENRHGIKLLDRCLDHPELGQLWQSVGREQVRLQLTRFLESRILAGQIRRVADPRLAARLVVETCATWAVHIHWDRAPEDYAPEAMRSNAIDFLLHGLIA